jgi:hypothetical protein
MAVTNRSRHFSVEISHSLLDTALVKQIGKKTATQNINMKGMKPINRVTGLQTENK